MNDKIIGMTFPKVDKNLGLEPSLLTVLPKGENVFYSMDNINYNDDDVLYYLCSVYITGMNEFKQWALKHDKSKIIIGGYEPTINPDEFITYGYKVIIGPCDDFFATIKQSGNIVNGITNYNKIPRYDLYDIKNNQQVIPDKQTNDICTSINTSQGCPFKCDFCCSPLMANKLMRKPLDLVQEEINYLKQYSPKFIFIRDENFPLQEDWKKKLKIINQLNCKIYLFASANTLNEETVKFMKNNGVYMICLGLEDITLSYRKNEKLNEACALLKKYGIYIYLSFIVNPLKVQTENESNDFYKKLLERFYELKPEMVCGNFLMPFRGTKIWDDYKQYVDEDDFDFYDSKSAFLIKDKMIRQKTEYNMFLNQWNYYTSEFYNKNIRKFEINDTLHKRFLELKEKFNKY